MPFQSKAQRRKFYAMADRGEISDKTVNEWEEATPKGKKLPEKVGESFAKGAADALFYYGLKQAAEERLQLGSRKFHGLNAALRKAGLLANKRAEVEATADNLAGIMKSFDDPVSPAKQVLTKNPLDRATAWGPPTNPSAGDTAGRMSDLGVDTSVGKVF